jgi:hypothetical protein
VSAVASAVNPDVYTDPSHCTVFSGGLAVTPPNTSATVDLTDVADRLSSCKFQITPVVPGTTGGNSGIS